MNNHDRTSHDDASREQFRLALRDEPQSRRRTPYRAEPAPEATVQPLSDAAIERLEADMATMGEPYQEPAIYRGCNGRTMFDSPASEDDSITG